MMMSMAWALGRDQSFRALCQYQRRNRHDVIPVFEAKGWFTGELRRPKPRHILQKPRIWLNLRHVGENKVHCRCQCNLKKMTPKAVHTTEYFLGGGASVGYGVRTGFWI